MTRPLALTLAVFMGVAAVHASADWPQWQGPDRNRISKETGLLPEWPSGGPRVLWTASGFGRGYGSMAIACFGKGPVTYADGRLHIQGENNVVGLVEATPSGYHEKGRFQIPDRGRMSWAHPAISDGRLYVRNQDTLLVYDIKATVQ
jgi:hypothetical protein